MNYLKLCPVEHNEGNENSNRSYSPLQRENNTIIIISIIISDHDSYGHYLQNLSLYLVYLYENTKQKLAE